MRAHAIKAAGAISAETVNAVAIARVDQTIAAEYDALSGLPLTVVQNQAN